MPTWAQIQSQLRHPNNPVVSIYYILSVISGYHIGGIYYG